MAWWCNRRESDSRSIGCGFNSWLDHYQVTTLGKLFTSMCLCPKLYKLAPVKGGKRDTPAPCLRSRSFSWCLAEGLELEISAALLYFLLMSLVTTVGLCYTVMPGNSVMWTLIFIHCFNWSFRWCAFLPICQQCYSVSWWWSRVSQASVFQGCFSETSTYVWYCTV